MIITVGMEKGGGGKSTVATNLAAMLAAQSLDVLLVDADIQGSTYLWNTIRDNDPELGKITCFQKIGRVRDEISKVKHKFDHIIIDTPGKKSIELQSSMLVSDLLIIPLAIGFFDVWTLQTMEELVSNALTVNEALRVRVLINRASTNAMLDDRTEAIAVLKNYPLLNDLMSTTIHERRAYRYATGMGRSVAEMDKPGKAKTEMDSLYSEVFSNDTKA